MSKLYTVMAVGVKGDTGGLTSGGNSINVLSTGSASQQATAQTIGRVVLQSMGLGDTCDCLPVQVYGDAAPAVGAVLNPAGDVFEPAAS